MHYITKKAKNGINVFLANRKMTDGKSFTDDRRKLWYFYNEADAIERAKYDESWRVIDEEELSKLLAENLSVSIGNAEECNKVC